MLHLDADRLAALADNEPTASEAAHLAECLACAREVDLHRALRGASADVRETTLDAPLTSWDALAPALREAGLLRADGARDAFAARYRPWIGAAAALLIGAGSFFAGRRTAPVAAIETAASQTINTPAVLTANTDGGMRKADGSPIQSLTDALKVMQRAEHDYRVAVAFIASHDSSYARGDADRYRARLAALDKVRDAALEGVNLSPNDPVLNQYLLSARSARDVTLQQLNNTLPAGVRLASY
jgi:hypothetical protein